MSLPSTPNLLSTRQKIRTAPVSPEVDVGKPLGVYDTNSVRDRILQWQAQGGGVVEAEDVGPGDSISTGTAKTRLRRKESSPHTPSEKAEKEDTAIAKEDALDHRARDRDFRKNRRPGSAPAKRVFSDGHWRKKRSPPKSASTSRTERKASPSMTQVEDSVRIKPASEPRTSRKERRARGEKSPETYNVEVVGTQGCITSKSARRESEQSQRRRSASLEQPIPKESNADLDDASFREDQGLQRDSSNPAKCPHAESPLGKDKFRRHRQSLQPSEGMAVPLERTTKGMGSTRSEKGNILSQVFGDSRKLFAKQAPEPTITPRIPSIEAWLENTSDPFVDGEGPAIEGFAPLKPSRSKQSRPEPEPMVEDPNQIWDKLDMKGATRRAMSSNTKKRRVPSSAIYNANPFPQDFNPNPSLSCVAESEITPKLVDLASRQAESPPSSLKRRAARKSVSSPVRDRQKSGSTKISTQADDIISNQSSQLTSSSVEGPDPSNPYKPPGLNIKRPFPSTGQHRLSTIASVETFNTMVQNIIVPSTSSSAEKVSEGNPIREEPLQGEETDKFDPDSLRHTNTRLTKHADLISVLSLPRAGSKSIRSARSIRTNRTRLENATVDDLMQELATDESKYMRELLTLVDGVIPVLLNCVLSKSDSVTAAGLFQPSAAAKEDPSFTRPIIDMGIALERLKTLHKRIPRKDPNSFLTWAHGAQRVYTEYLKAWRMGFQDVVVNLAPAAEDSSPSLSGAGLDEGLPRDENGDVINSDGERVDVAFLLKRPLVRLKYLSKSIKGIGFLKPSDEAAALAQKYQDLVEAARLRANEERARLEDEAAANIDATRCRNPRTLAPISGVIVDRSRRVRARDYFDLALQHSNGQCIDCRVELIIRDDAADTTKGGDLLICEVDGSGRWLLFPPIRSDLVSARNGDGKGEIVIMIRGFSGEGSQWHETLTLSNEEEQVGFEWVQMLGLQPVPPSIAKSRSFVDRQRTRERATEQVFSDHLTSSALTNPTKSRTPSPREADVPIGEQAGEESKVLSYPLASSDTLSISDEGYKDADELSNHTSPRVSTNYVDKVNDLRSLPSQHRTKDPRPPEQLSRAPRSFKEALGLSGYSTMSGLKRTKAKRISRNFDGSPSSPRSKSSKHDRDLRMFSSERKEVEVQYGEDSANSSQVEGLSSEPTGKRFKDNGSASLGLKLENTGSTRLPQRASTPSMRLPYIPKVRRASPPVAPTMNPPEELVWPSPAKSEPAGSPLRSTKNSHSPPQKESKGDDSGPFNPMKELSNMGEINSSKTPTIEPTLLRNRRSSSPLKHEYEPSSASDSSSDSDASTVERRELESMTETSDEEDLEDGDVPTPLMPLGVVKRAPKLSGRPSSLPASEGTLKPSDSASQAPYKTVPTQPKKAARTIALIFTWSDAGLWESLHPDECSIVITPGLIEAYEMSAAHSGSKPISISIPVSDANKFADNASTVTSQDNEVKGEQPLVALELTPLVPLRRGTAIDISIRSPPTANSQITSGNNIMFRSRNPEECEALYTLINHSRIHNPTYIALQNARGPFASGNSFPGVVGRRPSSKASNARNSWFSGFGRSPSYRASSARAPSIAPSESSVGSMSSAFSALKRFGRAGGGGMFNISLSTIMSRNGAGSGAGSVYTSSDNSSGSGAASPIAPGMVANRDGSLGLKDAKIRLYIRETASRWRDMGSARLTILPPEKAILGPDGKTHTINDHLQGLHEKRILVNGKTKGEILLDAQLGESCFERVARTGIAVSVWEDVVGPNGEVGVVGAVGGVAGGRAKVYMIQVCEEAFFFFLKIDNLMQIPDMLFTQMKSEAETAYTFSLVGKLRY